MAEAGLWTEKYVHGDACEALYLLIGFRSTRMPRAENR